MAAFTSHQVRHYGLARYDGSQQIYAEHGFPTLKRATFELVPPKSARNIDESIYSTHLLEHPLSNSARGILLWQIDPCVHQSASGKLNPGTSSIAEEREFCAVRDQARCHCLS
jgi:hypothetical protein